MGTPVQPLVPVLSYPPELLLQAQGIRVAFFDIDGVLTTVACTLTGRARRSSAFRCSTARV